MGTVTISAGSDIFQGGNQTSSVQSISEEACYRTYEVLVDVDSPLYLGFPEYGNANISYVCITDPEFSFNGQTISTPHTFTIQMNGFISKDESLNSTTQELSVKLNASSGGALIHLLTIPFTYTGEQCPSGQIGPK